MPNWTQNTLTIGFTSEQAKKDFLQKNIINDELDYNAVLPMPSELEGISKGHTNIDGVSYSNWRESGDGTRVGVSEAEIVQLQTKYGAKDWYEWATSNWGVKWNACDTEVHENATDITINWSSPWSTPDGWIYAMIEAYYDTIEFAHLEATFEGDDEVVSEVLV